MATPRRRHQEQGTPQRFPGFFRVSPPKGKVKARSAAHAEHSRERRGDRREGERDICRRNAQIADALTDKNLIDDIMSGVHQGTENAGHGELPQHTLDRLIPQGISPGNILRFHRAPPLHE
jgi:hypothetical protein